MIQPSPELLAVSKRWYETIRSKDTAALEGYLSASDELRFIGTGEGEFWTGRAVRDGIGDFFKEMPEPDEWEILESEAFENGETGWSSFIHRVVFPRFGEFIVRTVLIFVLERAAWKIVNRHASVPFPNMDFVGGEQLAIQKLIEAAREDGPELVQTQGLASVLFTDLEDSTTLAATLGDKRWSVLISDHFRVVEEIVRAHEGQFVKSLGDGTLACFPSASLALFAAVEMQQAVASTDVEPRLGLRIGIHTGDVVQARGDFFGTVVNTAARITTAAAAAEILVSDATRVMVAGRPDFRISGTLSADLKGLEGEHKIHRLDWAG